LEEQAEEEEKAAWGKFDELMKHFYYRFLDKLSPEEKATPYNI
jgi:hypothetical protein